MSDFRIGNRRGLCRPFLRCSGFIVVFYALAVFIGSLTPISAQDIVQVGSTALDDLILQTRQDAFHSMIESSLDRLVWESDATGWGRAVNADNLQLTTKPSDVFGTANESIALWKASRNRQEPAKAESAFLGFLLKVASRASDDSPLRDAVDFDKRLHEVYRTYEGFERQKEAQSLAFGGVLSSARIPEIRFAPPDFDENKGSFHTLNMGSRLSISGDWRAVYDDTNDRFDAQSRYAFNQLQTASGNILTGNGFVQRERIEPHGPFENLPLLRWESLFEFHDSGTVTERTKRHESYNIYFNGELADRGIQSATEFNPRAVVAVEFKAPAPALYDREGVKRPPAASVPPLRPPRPQPSVSSGDKAQEQKAASAALPKHRLSLPSVSPNAPGPEANRRGVMADIKISDADFAPPKKEDKK